MAHVGPSSSIGQILPRNTESTAAQRQPGSQLKKEGQTVTGQTPPIYADTQPTLHRLPQEIIQNIKNYIPNGSKALREFALASRHTHDLVKDKFKASRLLSRVAKLHTQHVEERHAEIDAIAAEVNDKKEVQLVTADQTEVLIALMRAVSSFRPEEGEREAGFTQVCNVAANITNPGIKEKVVAALAEMLFFFPPGDATTNGSDRIYALADGIKNPAAKVQINVKMEAAIDLEELLSFFLKEGGIDNFKRVCDLAAGIDAPAVKERVITNLKDKLSRIPKEDAIPAFNSLCELAAGIDTPAVKERVAIELLHELPFFSRKDVITAFDSLCKLAAGIDTPAGKERFAIELKDRFHLVSREDFIPAFNSLCKLAAGIDTPAGKERFAIKLKEKLPLGSREGAITAFDSFCNLAAGIDTSAGKERVAIKLVDELPFFFGKDVIPAFNSLCKLAADIKDPEAKAQVIVALELRLDCLPTGGANIDGFNRVCDLVAEIEDPELKAQLTPSREGEQFFFSPMAARIDAERRAELNAWR